MWWMKALMFSASFFVVEAQLADHGVHVAAGVVAELDLAGLVFAGPSWPTSGVTVPARGEGISPRGPSTLPSGPTRPIMSGAAMQASKSVQPSLIFLASSSAADFVGPGGLGRLGHVPLGEHDHPLRLADAVRQHDRAADDLIGLLGIDAQADGDLDRSGRTWCC